MDSDRLLLIQKSFRVYMYNFDSFNNIDEIIDYFQNLKKEINSIDHDFYRLELDNEQLCYECGGNEVLCINLYKNETDEEYNKRIQKEKEKIKKKKLNRILKQINDLKDDGLLDDLKKELNK